MECVKSEYGKLLDAYFGPDFAIDEALKLEGLRIPHFYHAFYVYKYATGLSAAIAPASAWSTAEQGNSTTNCSFSKAVVRSGRSICCDAASI